MKLNYLNLIHRINTIALLILVPLYAFSDSQNISSETPKDKNTQTLSYSNESSYLMHKESVTRSIDYPTQIIRMEQNVENQQVSCNEVHNQIDKILVQHIVNELFIYAIFVNCRYNPETNLASQFIIHSYFDPVSDDAINYLETYLREYNDTDLLGGKYKIEPAKGVIISLSIAAGVRKKPNKPPFIEYRKDRSNFYFKSNYEMRNKLFDDVYKNFFSSDPDKILPFLDKWIFSYAGSIYKAVLRDSNYVELQPERIFLMENNEEIFVSGLKQYFAHQCDHYENHRCLRSLP